MTEGLRKACGRQAAVDISHLLEKARQTVLTYYVPSRNADGAGSV
jgi:hypothetical protein